MTKNRATFNQRPAYLLLLTILISQKLFSEWPLRQRCNVIFQKVQVQEKKSLGCNPYPISGLSKNSFDFNSSGSHPLGERPATEKRNTTLLMLLQGITRAHSLMKKEWSDSFRLSKYGGVFHSNVEIRQKGRFEYLMLVSLLFTCLLSRLLVLLVG